MIFVVLFTNFYGIVYEYLWLNTQKAYGKYVHLKMECLT